MAAAPAGTVACCHVCALRSDVRSAPRRGAHPQTASFREFCARPENRPLVEKTQRKEIKNAVKLRTHEAAAVFRERFLAAPPEAQAAMAPFLQVPFLRTIVQTLANDERGDFGQWATNPRIVEMLTAAKEAIEQGRMSEEEATQLLIAHAKARARRGSPRGVLSHAWLFTRPQAGSIQK